MQFIIDGEDVYATSAGLVLQRLGAVVDFKVTGHRPTRCDVALFRSPATKGKYPSKWLRLEIRPQDLTYRGIMVPEWAMPARAQVALNPEHFTLSKPNDPVGLGEAMRQLMLHFNPAPQKTNVRRIKGREEWTSGRHVQQSHLK